MDNLLFSVEQCALMTNISEEVLRSTTDCKIIDGKDYIDINDINKSIINKKIKYRFSSVNIEHKNDVFASKREIPQNGYNVIDLFCGAGGSSSGFKLAGFSIIGALDINKIAAKTHELNFPECKTIVGDIATITPSEFHNMIGSRRVDIIIGSPPCQTFSSLSQGKLKSLGKDVKLDIRNYYYKNYLDYVTYFKPKVFLMENVPGFMTKYKGEIFKDLLRYIRDELPEYDIKYSILESQKYSVPQSRSRLFVCGFRKGIDFDFPLSNNEFCESLPYVTVQDAISDLPEITDDWRLDKLRYSNVVKNSYQKFMRHNNNDMVTNNICRISNPCAKELFKRLKPGERYSDLPQSIKDEIKLFDTFESSVIQGRCRRLPLNQVSWTIIAHIGMDGYEYIHPTKTRTLSVREAARLQSFTDDFIFVGNMREQYVQVGNAVPPLLSYAIAKKINISLLESNS